MAQARNNARTVDEVRRDLEQERDQLANAADSLRESFGEATNVTAKLRSKLPLVAGGALAAGFFLAGGVGATARLMFRRGREGDTKLKVGRIRFVDDD
jgi:ornithine cyclodeaminase/alanine dehydrogenase-like protein (mu-crystallin family)